MSVGSFSARSCHLFWLKQQPHVGWSSPMNALYFLGGHISTEEFWLPLNHWQSVFFYLSSEASFRRCFPRLCRSFSAEFGILEVHYGILSDGPEKGSAISMRGFEAGQIRSWSDPTWLIFAGIRRQKYGDSCGDGSKLCIKNHLNFWYLQSSSRHG